MTAFGWITTVVAVMFVAGIALGLRARHVRRGAVRVRARIVSRKTSNIQLFHGSMGSVVTRFQVDVPTKDGARVRVWLQDGIGDADKDRLVGDGDTVPVFHPAGHPERARVDSGQARYVIPAYLCAPGVLWAILLAYVAIAY